MTLKQTDKALVGHLYWVAAQLAEKHGVREKGYRAVMNCNENGGQTVYHIHLHVLAGKAMGWPPYQDHIKSG